MTIQYVATYLAFSRRGCKDYLSDNYVPYSGKLTSLQKEALGTHLDEKLYLDVKPFIAYVQEQSGHNYYISGMLDLLHRIGFSYKHTKAVPSKADEEAQLDFLTNLLPGLPEQMQAGSAEIYYSDGCHPTHNTKTGRGWIRIGQEFEVDCNSGRKRVNINGAIRASKPEHLVYDVTDTINAQATQRLCRKLLKKHPGKKIYLICDDARYNRCHWLQDWAVDQRIEFIFLPTYSPNLNLIERNW